MTLIFVYSVLLGAKDYTDVNNETDVNKFIKKIDPYFNVIIYAEFLLKIIAMGFILGEGTYMSDPWNWIDFVVVVSTFLELCLSLLYGGSNSFKMPGALRAIRLLRPLKLLNNIPALKHLIGTLIDSLASLGGIMGLAIFFFLIYSILGVSVWKGKFHHRCYLTEKPENGEWLLNTTHFHLCSHD